MHFERPHLLRAHSFGPTARALAAALAVASTLASCQPKTDAATGQPKTDSASTDSTASAPTAGPSTVSDSAAWTLNEFGYGPIKAGLTYSAANDSVKGALNAASGANLDECDYVKWDGGPTGLNVMVVEGKIARVDVGDSSTLTTDAGARVGDSEARIKTLYGDRVTVSDHKYEEGHYLTVHAANPTDTMHVIIFETANGKVTRFRGGVKPGVEYIEGCS